MNNVTSKCKPRCHVPWQQMVIDATGIVTPCCYWSGYGNDNPPMGNLNDESLLSIWNGEQYRRLRKYMAVGDLEKAGCADCLAVKQRMDLALRVSPYLSEKDESPYAHNIKILKQEIADGAENLIANPSVISYTPSHKCNLDCGHCYQETTRNLEIMRVESGDEVIAMMPFLDQLIAGGGEPLVLPIWRKLIGSFDSSANPHLSFAMTTNASILTNEIKIGLPKFRRLEINISIDGTNGVYEFVRKGGVWSTVTQNIEILRTIVSAKENSTIGFSCCVMKSTVLDLPNIIEFASKSRLQFTLSPVLTMPLNEALTCFNNFEEEAKGWREAFAKARELMVSRWVPVWMHMNSTASGYDALCKEWGNYVNVLEDSIPWDSYLDKHYKFDIELPLQFIDAYRATYGDAELFMGIWPFGQQSSIPKYYAKINGLSTTAWLPKGKFAVNLGTKWGVGYWDGVIIIIEDVNPSEFTIKLTWFGDVIYSANIVNGNKNASISSPLGLRQHIGLMQRNLPFRVHKALQNTFLYKPIRLLWRLTKKFLQLLR